MQTCLEAWLGIRPQPSQPTGASPPVGELESEALGLFNMPADALLLLCSQLPLQSLSRLVVTCSEAEDRIPDEAWRGPLSQCRANAMAALDRAGSSALREPMSMESHLMQVSLSNTASQQGTGGPFEGDEADELISWIRSANAVLSNQNHAQSMRSLCSSLRPLLCSVCDSGPATVLRFWATDRGVCEKCIAVRAVEVRAWKLKQQPREAAEIARRENATRDLLGGKIADHLPTTIWSPHIDFRLAFSSDRQGGSATALLRAARGINASILLITERLRSPHSNERRVFGAFLPSAWPLTLTASRQLWFGDMRSFLFSLLPDFKVHAATGNDNHFVHVSPEGFGFGGEIGGAGHALFLSADLSQGRCLPSRTFGDTSSLASAMTFLVENVQLWDVHDDLISRTRARPEWEGDENESVLKPGEDKLMLEFVGVERDIALLRRFNG
eukprot:scaffold189269_cov27-Tisochrysis_lutea.AAC.1